MQPIIIIGATPEERIRITEACKHVQVNPVRLQFLNDDADVPITGTFISGKKLLARFKVKNKDQ
jgi:hypothetical protein